MSTTLYTDDELLAMNKEAEAIGDLLHAVDGYLTDEKKGSTQTPKNVIQVDFKIKNEFTKVMASHDKISLIDILKKIS